VEALGTSKGHVFLKASPLTTVLCSRRRLTKEDVDGIRRAMCAAIDIDTEEETAKRHQRLALKRSNASMCETMTVRVAPHACVPQMIPWACR